MHIPPLEDLGNGQYRISLHEIQRPGSTITTKEVLMPLIQEPKYRAIEVLCQSVPSWLVLEIMDCRLPGEIEKLADGTMRVSISKASACG